MASRNDRLPEPKNPRPPSDLDLRSDFQKDRDRILYSSAHRRLGDVTQVVSADHGPAFHNRLTHSQKVAQIGQRIAERLLQQHKKDNPDDVEGFKTLRTQLDPEVVQAACFAHDLGHPPFGHIAEQTLNKLVIDDKEKEGFEGNAQSFRVITKLALIHDDHEGLQLTRATLAATLKYPWPRNLESTDQNQKYGYYRSEQDYFNHAAELLEESDEGSFLRSLEADVMNLSDDITYSVHDLEDFHRAGLIPWHLVARQTPSSTDFRIRLIARAAQSTISPHVGDQEGLAKAFDRLFTSDQGSLGFLMLDTFAAVVCEPYNGSRTQRLALRRMGADLIDRLLSGISIEFNGFDADRPRLNLHPNKVNELRILKEITRNFIHENVSLGAQQEGQRKIIELLYWRFKTDIINFFIRPTENHGADPDPLRIVSQRFHHLIESELEYLKSHKTRDASDARLAADCVAGLCEREAMSLYDRLCGVETRSATDRIVY